MPPLKIYIWWTVRCSYSCGGAMAIAMSVEEARASLLKSDELNGDDKTIISTTEPNQVVPTSKLGWTFVWNGGD